MIDEELKFRIRRARGKFIAMAGAYCLGVFNDNFFKQAVMLLALAKGLTSHQNWVVILFTIPYLLVAAPAGWLADRFPKGYVVIVAKGLEVLAMVFGAIGIYSGNWTLLLAMAFTMGLQSCLFGPALNGSIPELYPAEYVAKANAVLKVVVTVAILLGVVLAGICGLEMVITTILGISLVGLAVSCFVPKRPAADPQAPFPWTGPLATIRELGRVRQDSLLNTVFYADAFVWGTGALIVVLVNVMARDQFEVTDFKALASKLIGLELVGMMIGGVIGGRIGVLGRWYRSLPLLAFLMALLCGAVAALPLLSVALRTPFAFGLLGLIGIVGGAFMIPCESFIQIRPAPERRGVVIAASNFVVFGAIILTVFFDIFCKDLLRPTSCFGLLAVLSLVMATWLYRVLPREAA